jgi:hypothetical protein
MLSKMKIIAIFPLPIPAQLYKTIIIMDYPQIPTLNSRSSVCTRRSAVITL